MTIYQYQYVVQPYRLNYGAIGACLRKGLCKSMTDWEGTTTGLERKWRQLYMKLTAVGCTASYFVKIIWCSCWFWPPPLFWGRRRVAVARYRIICLVLVNSHLFPLPCGAGNAVPREGFDLSVIILASLLVFPMLGCRHSLLRLLAIFHVFVKWNAHFQTFLLVNTCQSGVIT